jgi:arginine decarboxylase
VVDAILECDVCRDRQFTVIRIVWGTGRASTPKASFDVALATANVHQYNLRRLSSVIPAGVTVEEVGSAPDLGPTGGALDAVLARQTSQPGTRAAAGLVWARGDDGTGIFYEEEHHDPATVRERLAAGIERGCELRGIDATSPDTCVVTADPEPEAYTTAVAAAVYGESERLC